MTFSVTLYVRLFSCVQDDVIDLSPHVGVAVSTHLVIAEQNVFLASRDFPTAVGVSEQFLNGTSAHNRPFQCHYSSRRFHWCDLCDESGTSCVKHLPVHSVCFSAAV